jgi:selenocysteine-specific elongation factor
MLSPIERNRLTEIEKIFSISDLKPPKNSQIKSNLDIDLVELLIDTGRLIVLQNISLNQTLIFHADALIKAANDLRVAFPTLKRFTTGEARTILNTTRRIIIPLLEYFDKIGITLRTGNQRQIAAANSVSSRKQKC